MVSKMVRVMMNSRPMVTSINNLSSDAIVEEPFMRPWVVSCLLLSFKEPSFTITDFTVPFVFNISLGLLATIEVARTDGCWVAIKMEDHSCSS